MKKIFLLTFMLIFIASNCFAMTFSQPVKIGFAGVPPYGGQSPYYKGGYFFKGTSYNEGNIIPESNNEYEKGLACWGDGINALYCKYQAGKTEKDHYLKFGGKNNYLVSDSIRRDISKIDTNEGITLYLLRYTYRFTDTIDIIGCRPDGIWVKYIDMKEIAKKYFGKGDLLFGGHYQVKNLNPISFQNDTIIIPYTFFVNLKESQSGEFRFKWDDAAQWFGVEKIVY